MCVFEITKICGMEMCGTRGSITRDIDLSKYGVFVPKSRAPSSIRYFFENHTVIFFCM